MKFRNKILLAIWSVVLILLLITSVIIKYWMGVQVENRSVQDLRSNHTTIRELNALRAEEILKSTEIISETPRLKAVVDLGDKNTALQLAEDMNRSILSDLFLLADSHDRPLVRLLDGRVSQTLPIDLFIKSGEGTPNSSIRIQKIGDAVYRCATVPMIIGTDRVGSLTLGFRFEQQDLAAIKAMTNSDAALSIADTVLRSTIPSSAQSALIAWLKDTSPGFLDTLERIRIRGNEPPVVPVKTVADRYLATAVRLDDGGVSHKPLSILLLRSVDRETAMALKPVFNTFLILSVIVLLVTAAIGYVISQGITRPIAGLIRGTTEISKGNYDYKISVGSDAELKYLAEKFQEMSLSLKDKMHQLAERNLEMEGALTQLQAMQTELLKAERLATTGKLTAQLSHEINNPVHNIQSCLQTLQKRLNVSDTSTHDRELLGVALDEVGRLAKLTRQMLDVYRTTMLPIDRAPVQLNEVVTEVLTASEQMLAKQNIRVSLSLAQGLPAVNGSKDKLKQVFLNLFLNAKDAMPQGGRLSVETLKGNGNVVVNVEDTGVGIARENINKIFDAFFTTKSAVSGVGLGLSVTYGIIRQHEGTITVRSEVGEGTTFSIQLPVNKA